MSVGELNASDKGISISYARSARPRRRYSASIVVAIVRASDGLFLLVALALSYRLRVSVPDFSQGELLLSGSLATISCWLLLDWRGAYRLERLTSVVYYGSALVGAVLVGALVFATSLALLSTSPADPTTAIVCRVTAWAALALVLLFSVHVYRSYLLAAERLAQSMRLRIAVVAADALDVGLIERFAQDPGRMIDVVGVFTEIRLDAGIPLLTGTLQDLTACSARGEVDAIVLALPTSDIVRIGRIRAALEGVIPDIYVVADFIGTGFSCLDLHRFGENPVVRVRRRPLDDWQQVQKAVFDRIFGGFLLVCLLPVLLTIGLAIRLDSTGPIFFRQPRLGFNNRPFLVYKFRTMFHHNDPDGLNGFRQARRGDPRITRVGSWLRKYSIDELPQLINVLRGEMSLVGPRPHPLNTRVGDKLFQEVVTNYAARHRVLPGITGWAQVNGLRGETLIPEHIEQRVEYDLYYIDHWSLGFDLRILLLTLSREILSKRAF